MTTKIKDSHEAHLYKVTDTVSGRFYIGKHGGRTQGNYWGSGLLIKNYIKKYGRSNLKYEILIVSTQEYIYNLEKAYVDDQFLKAHPKCMNLVKGGMGGNLGGVPHNKGKKMSDEFCRKLSVAKQGLPSPRKGVTVSEETKRKIGEANRGRVRDASTREKLRERMTGKEHRKVTCHHCNTIGGITGMARWHFDNCRQREAQ